MYPIEVRLAAKTGWHTPQEAKAYYGRYARDGITVHWWGGGEPASKHDSIVNYFLAQAQQGTKSVNYVVSDNKITLLVNPDNVAWASQSGNPTTISVEFQPTLSAEGYKKAGWLINELEGRYGKGLRLFPHNYWVATQCPGSLDINRMRAEADKWKRGDYNPKPAPAPTPVPTPQPPAVSITWKKWDEGKIKYVFNKDANLWNFNSSTWQMQSVKTFKKGEIFEAVGQATNDKLKATYYLTEYSFNKKITNGVNPADLDLLVVPVPVPPSPPPVTQPPAPTPLPPVVEPTDSSKLDFIYRAIKALLAYFKINI